MEFQEMGFKGPLPQASPTTCLLTSEKNSLSESYLWLKAVFILPNDSAQGPDTGS